MIRVGTSTPVVLWVNRSYRRSAIRFANRNADPHATVATATIVAVAAVLSSVTIPIPAKTAGVTATKTVVFQTISKSRVYAGTTAAVVTVGASTEAIPATEATAIAAKHLSLAIRGSERRQCRGHYN